MARAHKVLCWTIARRKSLETERGFGNGERKRNVDVGDVDEKERKEEKEQLSLVLRVGFGGGWPGAATPF